jgi:hypothetical protein
MTIFRTPRLENPTPRVMEATPWALRGALATKCFLLASKGLGLIRDYSEASRRENYPGGRGYELR